MYYIITMEKENETECKEKAEEPIKEVKKRGPKKTVTKQYRTTVWDPINRKCVSRAISVRKGEDEEVAKAALLKWKEDTKAKFKKLKAQQVIDGPKSDDEDKYDLKPLNIDFNNFNTGKVLGFIGSSGSGKTTLMKKIYKKYFEDEDFVTVLFAANKQAPIYKDIGNQVTIMTEFDERIPKIQKTIQKKTKNKYKFLNILDDQVSNSTKNNETLKKMVTSFRNSMMFGMISLQDKVLLSSVNRGNLHRIFFMKLSSEEAIEKIIKAYLGTFLGGRSTKMSEKIEKYKELTSNYKFIMLDTSNDTFSVHAP